MNLGISLRKSKSNKLKNVTSLGDFETELKELLRKYGYSGVMYNIAIGGVPKRWNLYEQLQAAHGKGSIVIVQNIFSTERLAKKRGK